MGIVPGPFTYTLFGLRLRSEIELPELVPADPKLSPDVEVSIGEGPIGTGPEISFDINGVGSYWVVSGSRVIIRPHADAPSKNVRLYLLGTAMGAVLHQRGILPLHANAIGKAQRAFAIMGEPGAGKSTLAAEFHDHGYRVIADDVCAISFDEDGRPWVGAGIPRLRMWRDALLASGRDPEEFNRSFAGDDNFDKYDVPLTLKENQPVQLGAIYVLADGDDVDMVELNGVDAVEAVFAHTYRGHLVAAAGSTELHWASAVRLIRSTPVFRLFRPRNLDRLGELRTAIERHFHDMV